MRAVALNTYHEKRSRAARRRMGATDSHTTARSVILPSEQAIAEGGGFNVRVGRHCVIFQCRRPCVRLVPVLKRAAWTSYGEIGHEATEYEPWRGRDQRGAVQSATQTNRRRIPCWGQERQQDLLPLLGARKATDRLANQRRPSDKQVFLSHMIEPCVIFYSVNITLLPLQLHHGFRPLP